MKRILLALVIVLMTITLVITGCKKEPAAPVGGGAITVEIFDRGTDGGRSLAYDNAWTNWIKAKVKTDLNLDVTFVPVGRWSENTDIVNLMASQSAPDVCYTYNGAMIDQFRDMGGVLDLAPYIDQYLPDLKKLLGTDPAISGKDFIYRQQLPSGAIYSIQAARVALAERGIFIRKDWLDALRLPMPTSIEQFYNTLVAFRDRANELPGNVGTRVIPFHTDEDTDWTLRDFIRHYMQPVDDRDRWVNTIHERELMRQGYKEGVREMNKWYNERLIHQDFPLTKQNSDDGINQLKSGVAGSFNANWDWPYRQDYLLNNDLARNVPGAEFVPVDLNLKNKGMLDKAGLYMFIPAFSQNPIGALQYLNWLAKPENYGFLQIGEEGVNHILQNGAPRTFAMPANHPWIMNSGNNIDYTMPLNGVQLGSDELNARVLALSYGNTPPDTIVNAYAVSVKDARANAVRIVQATVTQYSQVLQDKADALLSQAVIAPPAQFDRVFDTGYQDWLNSGAQEVFNERNRLWPR
ncbi:MAG: extracellular solute-binding protein [Treponema sp.]|jgi:putative aldouronate transport system substrate-binding protein|nr:extracellular solute-binding protein [Treponema sp.]